VGNVRTGDPLERARHLPKLGLREPAGEVRPDPSEVRERGSCDGASSRRRERGAHGPTVVRVPMALNGTAPDQSVDEPREPAGREHHPVREVAHVERPVRRSRQPKEHVVLRHREIVGGSELVVEDLDDVVMGVEQRLPCSELQIAQSWRGHDHERTGRWLRVQVLSG
jgi:hypothetical protein